MLYARKITEDGWFGKDNLDADSVSELGTTNHELSVWKISDMSDSSLVDNVALALALTKSKVEEFYMIFLNPSEIKKSSKWIVETASFDCFLPLKYKVFLILLQSLRNLGYN